MLSPEQKSGPAKNYQFRRFAGEGGAPETLPKRPTRTETPSADLTRLSAVVVNDWRKGRVCA